MVLNTFKYDVMHYICTKSVGYPHSHCLIRSTKVPELWTVHDLSIVFDPPLKFDKHTRIVWGRGLLTLSKI